VDRGGTFALRVGSNANCVAPLPLLLEAGCATKKHCDDLVLGLGSLVGVSLRCMNSELSFSYLFKSNIKVYDLHQEIARITLGIISTSALFLRATKQAQ
jgi:hypothetical protein